MSKVKKREEMIRKLLITAMYIAVLYKLYYLPQIHIIFEALLNGRDGFKPYLVLLGHNHCAWLDSQRNQLGIPESKSLSILTHG